MKLNRTLFSPAVFAYTLYVKFSDWRRWLPLILLCFLPSFVLVAQMNYMKIELTQDMQRAIFSGIKDFFSSTILLLVAAYIFVSDGLVSSRFIGDSDSLSLMFTRPMTRFCYVFSRFCGALSGIGLLFSLGFTLSLVTMHFYSIDISQLSWLDYLSLWVSAASFAAFLTFLHSARPIVAIISFIFILGCKGMAGEYSTFGMSDNKYLEMFKQICIFLGNSFGDLLPESIDLQKTFCESYIDWYAVVIFATNIIIFLLLASVALSNRELSYGSD